MGFSNNRCFWFMTAFVFLFFVSGDFGESSFFSLDPFLELYAPLRTNNSQCHADALYFKNSVQDRTSWALKMLDASSKLPSSIMVGNQKDLGNFDQCLAVRSNEKAGSISIIGKHCLVDITLNQTHDERLEEITLQDLTKTWFLSVCMPATCTPEDLLQQLEFSLKGAATEIRVLSCRSSLDDASLPLTSWIVIIVTLLLLVLIVTATWIEHTSIKTNHRFIKSVMSFSLITNGKILLNKRSGQLIESIYGIRVLSMSAILFAHVIKGAYKLAVNQYEIMRMVSLNPATCVLSTIGAMGVDAFFLISGILLARGLISQTKAEVSFSYFHYLLHHFLRITPPYLYLIFFRMTVFPYCGDGPVWEYLIGHHTVNCINSWWSHLLYVNNYFNSRCMSWTWYLAVDMQLYMISPLFLFILSKKRWLGISCIGSVSFLSCLYVFKLSYSEDVHLINFITDSSGTRKVYRENIHYEAVTWVPPYLIGVLLGYFLECSKTNPIAIDLPVRILGWMTSAVLMVIVSFFPALGIAMEYGNLPFSLFEALYRPLFAIVVGWIIFACSHGYGGWVDRFLSHLVFRVLSRLSFCFYLLHPIVIEYKYGTTRAAEYFSYYSLFQDVVSTAVIVLLGAVILAFAVEYPSVHLVKLIFRGKGNNKTINNK